jgi:hypothetical protein
MHCLDTEGFVDSKRTICDDWRQERHNIRVWTEKKRDEMESLKSPVGVGVGVGGGKGTRRYRKAKEVWEEMNRMLVEKNGNPPSYTHRALIKIAVWPVIRRYTPGSAEEDADGDGRGGGKPLREKDGFRIFMVGKGAVVAYYGRDVKREEEYCGLSEWVGVKERQREISLGWLNGKNVARVLSVVAAAFVVGKAGFHMDQAVGMGGTEIVGGILEGVREGAREFVETGLESALQYAAALAA